MHSKKHISCSIMIVLIVAFDRITKYFATRFLADGMAEEFIPGVVQLRYARNTGIAFSMFSGGRWLFIILTVAVCVGVLIYMFTNRCSGLWTYWSLGIIVAGGIGNLIDRICYGYVVDFIEPVFVDFAIFNIADCAVTCGAAVLIVYLVVDVFKSSKGEKNG